MDPLKMMSTPGLLMYQEDGQGGSAPPEGQGALDDAATQAVGDPSPEGESSSFFEWDAPDGSKVNFTKKDELAGYLRDGTLRHQDYTKKTQSLSEERKKFESEREQFMKEQQSGQQRDSTIQKMDAFLKSRPDVEQYILQQMRSPSAANLQELSKKTVDESVSPLQKKLDELENWKKGQETAAQRQHAYEMLQKQYPDFDPEAVQSMIDQYTNLAPGDEMRAMAELIYYAQKGKMSPAELEQQMAENLRKKGSVPSVTSGSRQVGGKATPKTLDEAAALAKQEFKMIPE